MTDQLPVPDGYDTFLSDLKNRIRTAQVKAALAVNKELVLLYWQIGREILTRQERQGWGAKVIKQVSQDLRREFPGMKGLSERNLKYMRAFAAAYQDEQFVQQAAAQIPWFTNCVLIDKVKDPPARQWYIQQTMEHGWSRSVLEHQVESGLYQRKGKAMANFEQTLPQPQSDLARELLKDPYNFEFLDLAEEVKERDLERALVERIRDFLLELGVGFSFMGSQYRLNVGGEDFYIDLLFYHVRLRCYVIIDLKMTGFKPDYSGQMGFYTAVVDDLLRHPDDNPSIGIILCKSKNKTVVEYALKGSSQPMGVSTYRVGEALPESVQESLPTAEQLEQELASVDNPEDE